MPSSSSMCKCPLIPDESCSTANRFVCRIVGEHASSRSADFASALFFAHEYGIMAVSLEDRPFIPRSYVAIGGVPEPCKTVFRKWDRRDWNKAVKVLPLNAAIEAIRS